MARAVDILGVEFYPITKNGAYRAIDWMLSLRDGKTRIAVTANPIMVMTAGKDAEFARILENADLLVPDGVGITWAANRMGRDLPERVTGVDLTEYLLSKKPGVPIFLLGGKPGVAERAKERVAKEKPHVNIAGFHHGYFGPDEEPAVVEKVKRSGARAVLAGMGSPSQEKFLWRNRDTLGASFGIGVGGVLDILAGDKELTPEFLRKMGLEWLHRLVREPGRIKADIALAEFAAKILAGTLFGKQAREGDQDDDEQGSFDARRS